MRKSLWLSIAVGVATCAFAAAAVAATSGAHFFNVTSSVNSSGSLLVGYDEAGVGNGTVNYTIDVANATAGYACVNNGGKNPSASNKEFVNGSLTVSFSRDPKNGRVTGTTSPAIGPLSAGSFSCPSGQTLTLICVSYSGITLTDTTNNVMTAVPNAALTLVSGVKGAPTC
jgi:hypothetical protein